MDVEFNEPSLNSLELPQDTEEPGYGTPEISVYSAKISHDSKGRSPKEIWESEMEEYSEDELEERQSGFLNKLARAGHMSVFYQANVGLNLEVPRHTTMFLCQFPHSKYLQQSQRYTEASEFISELDDAEELYSKQAQLYEDMIEDGISKE
ncbi:MAG: FAD-dependent thymidylate synthase, partial [Candidatus Aenigmatarchaeota archaeon]